MGRTRGGREQSLRAGCRERKQSLPICHLTAAAAEGSSPQTR